VREGGREGKHVHSCINGVFFERWSVPFVIPYSHADDGVHASLVDVTYSENY